MRIEDLIGKQLGRYKITRILGRGGMAAVFEADDTILRRPIALKVLYAQYVADADLVERFRREAILAARLEHTNIVPIYDVGESDGVVYIAMKLLSGRSLQDTLLIDSSMSPEQVGEIVRQVASALDYAHGRGVIHRDIKPGNVMLDDNNQVILTDFGIAKSLDTPGLTSTGVMIGTPDYMAPEQIDSKIGPVDARADIYSLAVMAYRMLTGVRPFDGSTTDILLAHLSRVPEAASLRNPHVPPSIDAVLSAALAKNPAERTKSAGLFARSLNEAIGAPTGVATTPPPGAKQAVVIPSVAAEQIVAKAQATSAKPSATTRSKRPATWPILLLIGAIITGVLMFVTDTVLDNRQEARQTLATEAAEREQYRTQVAQIGVTQTAMAGQMNQTATPTLVISSTATIEASAPSPTTVSEAPSQVAQVTNRPVVTQALPVAPTSVPTTAPTNNPPTATPAPTTISLCLGPLQGGFGSLWRNNPSVAEALGCPTTGEAASTASIQYFDGGMMYWVGTSDQIYVYYSATASGAWQGFANPNDPSYDEPRETAPAGKLEPIRGFGTLWHTLGGIRETLGWANSPEYPITGVVQYFPNGLMLHSPALEGRPARIWVMTNDGTWSRYTDPNS